MRRVNSLCLSVLLCVGNTSAEDLSPTHFRIARTPQSGLLTQHTIRQFFQDNLGDIWLATIGGGLIRYDAATRSFIKLEQDRYGDRLLSDNISAIHADDAGCIWIGYLEGKVSYYDPYERAIYHIDALNHSGEKYGAINDFAQHSYRNIWVATSESGLLSYHRFNKTLQHYSARAADNKFQFPSDNLTTVAANRITGQLWVATRSEGLIQMDIASGRLTRFDVVKVNSGDHEQFTTKGLNGKPGDNEVTNILQVEANNVWAATNGGGINLLFSSRQEAWGDGLQGNEFNIGAPFKDSRGRLYFGGYLFIVLCFAAMMKKNYDTHILRMQAETLAHHMYVTAERAMDSFQEKLNAEQLLQQNLKVHYTGGLDLVSQLLEHQAMEIQDETLLQQFANHQQRFKCLYAIEKNLIYLGPMLQTNFHQFVETLFSQHQSHFGLRDLDLPLVNTCTAVAIPAFIAAPLAIITNELVDNSCRHAFERRAGIAFLKVNFQEHEDRASWLLEIIDNGRGLPASVDPLAPASLGLSLVKQFTERLAATLTVHRRGGTHFSIRVPRPSIETYDQS